MYSVETDVAPLSSAALCLTSSNVPVAEGISKARRDGPLAAVWPVSWPDVSSPERPTLVVWAEGIDENSLRELAGCEIDVYNSQAPNLLSVRLYISLRSSTLEIRVDEWELATPLCPDSDGVFRVILISGEIVAAGTHSMDEAEAVDFVSVLQAHGISSGANYRPSRSHTQSEIDAAADKVDEPDARVITCCGARIHAET